MDEMFDAAHCNFRRGLRITVIAIIVFLGLSMINSVALMSLSHVYYNTSIDCIVENITGCFNPGNVRIFQWAITSAFVIVMGAAGLFVMALVINHWRKKWKSSSYDIVTTPYPCDEFEIGSVEDEDSSNTDTLSVHDKTE